MGGKRMSKRKDYTRIAQTHDIDDLDDLVEDECQSTPTSVKRDIDSKTFDRLRKRQKVQRVQKRVVDDRPERYHQE